MKTLNHRGFAFALQFIVVCGAACLVACQGTPKRQEQGAVVARPQYWESDSRIGVKILRLEKGEVRSLRKQHPELKFSKIAGDDLYEVVGEEPWSLDPAFVRQRSSLDSKVKEFQREFWKDVKRQNAIADKNSLELAIALQSVDEIPVNSLMFRRSILFACVADLRWRLYKDPYSTGPQLSKYNINIQVVRNIQRELQKPDGRYENILGDPLLGNYERLLKNHDMAGATRLLKTYVPARFFEPPQKHNP